jgi:phosphoribosyl 1,2-cyclic phosphate phosphodiesterase
MMNITFLGTGTSTGVPEIGCTCAVCTSADVRNRRLRASALVETEHERILIDCGPDFREQIMTVDFRRLDAVLVTHEHYDHVGGIDDLRPFCRLGEVPIYVEEYTGTRLRQRIPYCFGDHKYPGVPKIRLEQIEPGTPFRVGTTEIMPLRVMHGALPILGYRIGRMAYITDMKSFPEEQFARLEGIDTLIVNALRLEEHPTHQNLEQALEFARRVGVRETYFIHMSHQMGLHAERERELPEHVHLAYDGLQISVD